jgi:hypothetical protein
MVSLVPAIHIRDLDRLLQSEVMDRRDKPGDDDD